MSFDENEMTRISVISADDAKEWNEFLSEEIEDLGKVNRYILSKNLTLPWKEISQGVACIILSPAMLESNKQFIQISNSHIPNPIVVLCGVPLKVMNQFTCCKPWNDCDTLTVNSSEDSANKFYTAIAKRLNEDKITDAVTLVPETIVPKTSQSCVLLFSQAVLGQVDVLINGQRRKFAATKTDAKTYIFNVPELDIGSYKINVFVSNKMIPTNLSLTVINTKPSKCPCDFILKILDSDDFQPLDDVLRHVMENDYSNRLFYQRISKPNPDFPEFPTALHFASRHGLYNVLEHLLELPGAKEGPKIKNDKDKNCLDIAKETKHSSTLVPVLQKHCDDSTYMDMTKDLHKKPNNMPRRHSADSVSLKTPPSIPPRTNMPPIIGRTDLKNNQTNYSFVPPNFNEYKLSNGSNVVS